MLLIAENIAPSTQRWRRWKERKSQRQQRNARHWTRRKQRLAYAVFVEVMIERRKALGLSQLELDAIAGFAEGHTAKLENFRSRTGRYAGAKTLPRWIAALWNDRQDEV